MKFVKLNRPDSFYCFMVLILLSSLLTSCTTTQVKRGPDQEHIDAAKRFLRAINVEKMAMIALKRAMESGSKEYPESLVEVFRRAISDDKAEDYMDVIARIYVHHLDKKQLIELARFAESPTGQRFFQVVIDKAVEEDQNNAQNKILSRFSEDELTEILKFASSDAFKAMNKAQPEIQREMSEAAPKFFQDKMREYLEKKQTEK